MRKMKKMKYLRFLMTIQVEYQTQSQMHQSNLSKKKMRPSMTSSKESSSRNQTGSNMVPGRCSGKEKTQKKIPPSTMIQQNILKLLTNANNFLRKIKKSKDEIFGDMVAYTPKGFSCSILKVKFKHEVNNPVFKYQMLNLEQHAQPNPPHPISTQHLSAYNSPFSKQWCSIHAEHKVSIFAIQV